MGPEDGLAVQDVVGLTVVARDTPIPGFEGFDTRSVRVAGI